MKYRISLVVGDKASNMAGLCRLGYEIVELDVKDDVVHDMNIYIKK